MGLFKTTPLPAPTPIQPLPLSLEAVYGSALASTGYAKSIFVDAVEALQEANADLGDVAVRAASEIDRLASLRDEAIAQREANAVTISNLQDLIG